MKKKCLFQNGCKSWFQKEEMIFLKRGENLPCHQLGLIPLTAVSVSGKEAVEKAQPFAGQGSLMA